MASRSLPRRPLLRVNRALCELIGYARPSCCPRPRGGDTCARPNRWRRGGCTARRGEIGALLRNVASAPRRQRRVDAGLLALVRDGTGEPLHIVVADRGHHPALEEESSSSSDGCRIRRRPAGSAAGSSTSRPACSAGPASSLRSTAPTRAGPAPRIDELLAMIHPDDRRGMLEATRANMASGATFTDEYRVLHPTLGTRTIVVRGRYLPRDAQGARPARLAGTTHDVTAEREAEAARRDLAERQRLLLASLPGRARGPVRRVPQLHAGLKPRVLAGSLGQPIELLAEPRSVR